MLFIVRRMIKYECSIHFGGRYVKATHSSFVSVYKMVNHFIFISFEAAACVLCCDLRAPVKQK